MLHIQYCKPCFEKLQGYGSVASQTYIEICEHYAFEQEPFLVDATLYEETFSAKEIIKFLELKKYILTTDIILDDQQVIAIKPCGHTFEVTELHTFCNKNHD